MENVISHNIRIHSNQVQVKKPDLRFMTTSELISHQFSLIDSRPVVRMAKVCEKHNVKLLTYGTLVSLAEIIAPLLPDKC